MAESTTTTHKRLLGTLASAEQYDDFKWKATAKLITVGLYQPIAEGKYPPRRSIEDTDATNRARAERAALIATQKSEARLRLEVERQEAATEQAPAQPVQDADVGRVPAEELPDVPMLRREENDAEYTARTEAWAGVNSRLWGALVEACDGEALQIAKRVPNGDGLALWKELEERFESSSMATIMAWVMQLLVLKLLTGCVDAHITKFRGLVMKQMQKQALNIHQLYKDAIEFGKARVGADEADNKGMALIGEEKKTRGTGRAGKRCRYGNKCKKWASGDCGFWHPKPNDGGKDKGKGKGKDRPQEYLPNWECKSCGASTWGRKQRCWKCNEPRTGAGAKRKADEANMATIAQLRSELNAANEKMAVAKDRAEQSGVVLNLGLMVTEVGTADIVWSQDEAITKAVESVRNSGRSPQEIARIVAAIEGALGESAAAAGTVTMKADSGATNHYVSKRTKLTGVTSDDTVVAIANGEHVNVNRKGTFKGTTADGAAIQFAAKQCDQFTHNLFSIRHAVVHGGCRAVFDTDTSYVEHKTTGHRIPMQLTEQGWDVVFQQ